MAAMVDHPPGFLDDRHGRTFADVLNDPQQPWNRCWTSSTRGSAAADGGVGDPPRSGSVGGRGAGAGSPGEDRRVPFRRASPPHQTPAAGGGRGRTHHHGTPGLEEDRPKRFLGVRAAVARRTSRRGPITTPAVWPCGSRAERYVPPGGKSYPSVKDRTRKLATQPAEASAPPPNANGAKEHHQTHLPGVDPSAAAGTCQLRIDGLQNAQWLINRLSQSFVFKTSEPLYDDLASGCANFAVPITRICRK